MASLYACAPSPPANPSFNDAIQFAFRDFETEEPARLAFALRQLEREVYLSVDASAEGNLKGAGVPANRIVFSEKFACPVSGFTIEEIEPRLFSFNAPQGACATCDGIGEKQLFDPQLVVPNEALTLKQGAIMPWAKSNPPSPYYMQVLASLAKEFGFDLTTPWQDLGAENQDVILYGTKGKRVPLTFKDGRKQYTVNKPFEGVIGNLNRRLLQTESAWMRDELAKFQTAQPCETCGGKRLNEKALSVKIGGPENPIDIATPSQMSVGDAKVWFENLPERLTDQQQQIARAILKKPYDKSDLAKALTQGD